MVRRTVQALSCLFLFSLVVYIYTYRGRPTDGHRRGHVATKGIPAIVVFENSEKDARSRHCPFPLTNVTVDRTRKWQKVGNESEWSIYSAYADNRLENLTVRIIAMARGGTPPQRLFCRVWYNAEKSSVEEIRWHELWIHAWDMANPGQFYQPFLLSCPAVADPVAVSVINGSCGQPQNLINLTSPDNRGNNSRDFVVCLKPLNFPEDISLRLLEWLELQFLLGADRVFAYVYRVHPRTWKVLKHYEREGKVGIQIHALPSQEGAAGLWQKRRHEMVVYNDCFYRHIHSHRFVVNLDLDEAIVPVNHSSWRGMLDAASLDNPHLQPSASISAPNVYFFDSLGESTDPSVPPHMHMLRHIFRSANFTPPGFAQKSFFSTHYTLAVSNHYTLRTLHPQARLMSSVGVRFGHLHHYRKTCPPSMDEDCAKNYLRFRTKDKSLWKFKDQLVDKVQLKMREIGLDSMPDVKEKT